MESPPSHDGERRRPFIGRKRLASQRPKPGFYRHYKGKYYEVIESAMHSENLQVFVVYRALYGEGNLWVRPRSLFLGTVDVEGVKTARFVPVDRSEVPELDLLLSAGAASGE